jgi:O-methyltransferase
MLQYTPLQRLRQFAARIPGAAKLYDRLRLTFAATYREDGLVTTHNCDFIKDPDFLAAYSSGQQQQTMNGIRWRAHTVMWASFHAKQLDGDFVECGVYRGFLSKSIMTYIDFANMPDRQFHLIDTYSGLVSELVTEEDSAAYRNDYEDCYEFVKQTFANFQNVNIVRGSVPEILPSANISTVAYLSIDMNCTQPEVDALEYFWSRLVSGGVVVLDDYGFSGHEAQKAGADKFAESVGARVLTLPTGQGLILKP